MGIGKIILRDAQHLAALTVVGDALVLTMLRYADELVEADQFKFPSDKEVRAKELELAKMLVKNLEADWNPEQYTDDYKTNLVRLIREKLKGRKPEVVSVAEPQNTAVVDLMERLRQSLESGRKRRSAATGRRRRNRTGRAAA